ncbi:uncharacterized protein LOC121719611 isoform X1 [Alosa sapidissima]|uniref:uncharacterized protein LOC121719611 isoform X1 n=1 Tax=Alosa sapidissima TaxID=34773 RepID=UPI001C0A359A|nr:uncharacterized protein LOC121719611 isoform X1 [Alosa sapidissima]
MLTCCFKLTSFSVKLDQLTAEDAGEYWCGVQASAGESITLISWTQLFVEPEAPPSSYHATYAFIPMAVFGVVPFVYMKCKRKISVSAAPSRKTTAPSATPEPAVYENDLTATSQDEVPSNTTAPESVYQSLNPNIMVQDPVYHQLNPNTMVQYPVYQSLNPNTMVQNSVYHQLNPDTMVQDPVYQHLNPNTMVQNSVYHQLNPNTMVHDPVNQCLNRV